MTTLWNDAADSMPACHHAWSAMNALAWARSCFATDGHDLGDEHAAGMARDEMSTACGWTGAVSS